MNLQIFKSAVIISVLQLSLSCSSSADPEISRAAFDFTEILPPTGVNFPDSSRDLYIEDASRLALREIFSVGSNDTSKVEIPQDLVNTIYNGFLHLYNSESAARDSVFKLYLIHTFRAPAMHSLIVSVDSAKEWVKSWREGNRLTGNKKIDDIMNEYDLELDNYYEWPWSHAAVLFSEKPVNLLALAALFEPVDGVGYSEPNGYAGDGNNITALDEESHWEYTFSVGWGDCPAGCISRHYWNFNVHPDGTVEFTGSAGSPLPS